jgi:hypothetical protein
MGLKIFALCKTTVPASVWDNPIECPWATLYSMSPLHLVPLGVDTGLYVYMVDTSRYNKFINDTLILFDLVNSDGVTTVPERVSLIEKYLFRLCRLKKYHDVLSYKARTAASKSKPIDAITCVLHMHKRMIEKCVSMLFKEALHNLVQAIRPYVSVNHKILQSRYIRLPSVVLRNQDATRFLLIKSNTQGTTGGPHIFCGSAIVHAEPSRKFSGARTND